MNYENEKVISINKETEFASMIKNLRSKFSLTQEQFAAKEGVAFSTVNRWENGRGTTSPLAMHRIEELKKKMRNPNKDNQKL